MKYIYQITALLVVSLILVTSSCRREIEELEPASFPTNGAVFIDEFSAGLSYAAFGGSKVTAFEVDTDVRFQGSSSMRFEVPDAGDPEGGYAGGVFFTAVGRDLSGYDALTFYAKASKGASLDVIGFGNDLGESKYQASLSGVELNSNWQKIIIPIPDSSKLTQERGMLYYSEAPENGKGYTFWIDEVKFEKLGTLAHPKAAILEGQDQTVVVATGEKYPLGGLSATFNMPTGIDQRVEVAPAYFTFSSSETSIATVDNSGVVMILDAGQAVITAKLGELDAEGSFRIESTGDPVLPTGPAPTPTVSPDSVISMFSNAYTDVVVDTWNTGWEFSTATTDDITINGDDVKRYRNLNFVGIEFTSQTIDATRMTHFHMDIWTPDATDLPAAFKVLLVDFGANNTFDGGDDSSHEVSVTSPTLQTGAWVSLDFPLSSFAGLSARRNLAQLVLSGDLPNVIIDNVYFYIGEEVDPGGPATAAPSPTRPAGDVISVFSDAYSNIPNTDFYPDWGQGNVVSEISIDGNNTLLYSGLDYQGIQLDGSQDVSSMSFLHIDYWTANSGGLNAFLISDGPVETPKSLNVPTSGWESVDIPLGDFSPVDLADLIQFKFDGSGDIYLDNIYFHNGAGTGGGDVPTEAAPEPPSRDAADVVSIFSDAYTNLPNTNYFPDWGQANVVSDVMIDGNNTLLYTGLDYQGTELASSQDISGMTHMHVDYWTANSSALETVLISTGPAEGPIVLPVPTMGWNSVDIELGDFTAVDLADLIQLMFRGNGDIYLDNIYFYKAGGGGNPDIPSEAAPTPPSRDAADVVSIFSDAYTSLPNTNFFPDWGQANVVSDVMIAGNNTLLYTGLDYQGTELESSQDISGMTHMHVDYWTANSSALETVLISTGPAEGPMVLPVPTMGWNSVDVELSDFSTVDLADLIQLMFRGNGDIYLDNIYFYKAGGGGNPDIPSEAAPTPPSRDAANVVSIFSDAYTSLPNTNFFPDWGQANVVSNVMIDNNNTLLYSGLDYQGTELESSQDISGMTHMHVDYWTANSSALETVLISTGPAEGPMVLPVPTMGWNSVDVELSDFSTVDLADLIQLMFRGNGDIYLDNIYFYKE